MLVVAGADDIGGEFVGKLRGIGEIVLSGRFVGADHGHDAARVFLEHIVLGDEFDLASTTACACCTVIASRRGERGAGAEQSGGETNGVAFCMIFSWNFAAARESNFAARVFIGSVFEGRFDAVELIEKSGAASAHRACVACATARHKGLSASALALCPCRSVRESGGGDPRDRPSRARGRSG